MRNKKDYSAQLNRGGQTRYTLFCLILCDFFKKKIKNKQIEQQVRYDSYVMKFVGLLIYTLDDHPLRFQMIKVTVLHLPKITSFIKLSKAE